MTQKSEILEFMKENGGITSKQAIRNIGCTRLAARIADLERDGWAIDREWVRVGKRGGGKTSVVRYSLHG